MKWTSLRKRDRAIRRAWEETLSVAKMARKDERVRAAGGLQGGECYSCDGLVDEKKRPSAAPVWASFKTELRTE